MQKKTTLVTIESFEMLLCTHSGISSSSPASQNQEAKSSVRRSQDGNLSHRNHAWMHPITILAVAKNCKKKTHLEMMHTNNLWRANYFHLKISLRCKGLNVRMTFTTHREKGANFRLLFYTHHSSHSVFFAPFFAYSKCWVLSISLTRLGGDGFISAHTPQPFLRLCLWARGVQELRGGNSKIASRRNKKRRQGNRKLHPPTLCSLQRTKSCVRLIQIWSRHLLVANSFWAIPVRRRHT